ncbi:potassium channel family protein [uncultured Clostridium sp.]|uniref:potassium channel family protein n=1 Tax=uncultured Clostridium sp. TaxID=59620 RepID=UPI0026278562|nr:potassium channel family protein [uncultured Clostridium sp.]
MGYIMASVATLIVVLILGARAYQKNKNLKHRFLRLNREIIQSYKSIYVENSLIKFLLYITLITLPSIFTFGFVTKSLYIHIIEDQFEFKFVKILLMIVVGLMVYYFIGYILILFSKINKFIRKTEDIEFRLDLLTSYFLISTYLFLMILFPIQFENLALLSLASMLISYLLNMKLLFRLMINPRTAKSRKDDAITFNRILIAAILILLMIILNLYLSVCTAYSMDHLAYTNTNGYFSLFYYTIISFTTIGYGDIVPVSDLARLIAIIISITSVVSLTIFLGSILSYKDKFK